MLKIGIDKLIWCTLLYSVQPSPRPQPKQANGAVLLDVIKLGPSKVLYSPDYPNDIPPQAQKEWRSDADPDGTAIKNFILKIEKTNEKATNFKPREYAGVKRKITVRSAGNGPTGRGPPGRGPPGRGPGRGPPPRGGPGGGGGGPGGGGRGGPPARGGGRRGPPQMVDVLNPELANQLAVAQSAGADFNPGHSPSENFNPNQVHERMGQQRAPARPQQRPQQKPQQSPNYYDYYDYPKPKARPKPKVNLKSAPPTEDPAIVQRRLDRMQKEAEEEEAMALRAEKEFKNSLILPSLMLVIGIGLLAFVVNNKRKIDEKKAKEAALNNETVSGNPVEAGDSLESDPTSESEPKSPEDAQKIEELYKEKPLPVISEDPSEKS